MPATPVLRRALSLPLAIAASLLLHGTLLLGQWPQSAPPPVSRLEVKLITPPVPPPAPELLEKNTLVQAEEETPPPAPPPPPPALNKKASPQLLPPAKRLPEQHEQRALRKVSEYIIYPQAAVDAGREGTVHVLLSLTSEGVVTAASVAASSGHRDLDEAALAAIRHVGRINVGGKTEFILPFTFRLQ